MSVEVVGLLLRVGASEAEVEDTLSRALGAGQSFARALSDGAESLQNRLDRELSRIEAPSLELVRPDAEQLALLPPGLAERLGAVPVRKDPRSGRVDVAVLDPLDRHVIAELEFHLGAKVRVLRADPGVLKAALTGSMAPRAPSGPPLPLVRRAVTGEHPRLSSNVPFADAPPPATLPLTASDAPPPSEPVLHLSRAKSLASSAVPAQPALPFEQVEATLARTRTPDDVVAALLLGLVPAPAVVLAVRSNAYVGRAGSPELSQVAVRKLEIPAASPSVVQTATRSGFYLGALPHTPAHAALRALFEETDAEMYVASVSARGHAVLVIVCEPTALGGSVDATRRVDALAAAAGQSLERIMVSRKRGS